MNNNITILLFVFTLLSCNKKENQNNSSYNNGELFVLADDSFKYVTEALAEGYMISYPETKIKVIAKKEDLAFLDILNNKAKIIVMSRDLSKKEISEYEKRTETKFKPAKFAADAVVFVVPKNSSKQTISIEEIKNGLISDEKPFIFDGTNSSNLNFVAQKIGKKPSDLKFSIINGNENLIEQINKYPNKIGVIGYNTFSRPYNKSAENLREMIKILPINKNGKIYEINPESLRKMEYPFTRIPYFLINESGFNIASGFIRFSCTHIGQKIVEKEGLPPYNLYKREVQMH